MSDTINGAGTTGEWFFTENGQRKGPVTIADLLELLRAEKVNGDTPVWTRGLSGWQALRTTDLGVHLQDAPPPVAPAHINNGLVWTLAILPIPYAFLTGISAIRAANNPYEDHTLLQLLAFGLPALLNAVLCLLDERQMKRAGYADKWLTLVGVLLAPAYLFLRASRLRQTPSYGFAWVVSFVLGLLILFA